MEKLQLKHMDKNLIENYFAFYKIFIHVFQLEFFRVLNSLSFYLYIVILTGDPVNPSLDPVTHLVWLEISLLISLLLLYI